MRLQFKILLYFIVSSFIATVISLIIINLSIKFFDQSYGFYDLEKNSLEIVKEVSLLEQNDPVAIKNILQKKLTALKYLEIAYFTKNGDVFFANFRFRGPGDGKERDKLPSVDEIKHRIEEDEKHLNTIQKNRIKFVEYFDNRELFVHKPLIIKNEIVGFVILSIKKQYMPPFSIRLNRDKMPFLFLISYGICILIIILSYIFIILFTIPLSKRLKILINRISNFELNKPSIKIHDNKNDEISLISHTFNLMADKINQDYSEKLRFYQERQELMKNISHDFRTPLTSILGYAVSLDEEVYENEEEQKRYYKIIRKKAEYMTELFDELMELSRLDNNTYLLKKTNFDFAEQVREIIIEYLPQLEKENFFIETDIVSTLIINGDKDRLSRAVRNLIDNVIRHSSQGRFLGVTVQAKDESSVLLIIKDKGPGISSENLEKVFTRFYPGTKSGGMGLGLSIAKEIIEKHGGKIILKSELDNGSTFTIELPKNV